MAGQKVAIIGGGAVGSAIASFLLGDPAFAGEVTVIERDPSYARASSALSASSIRQQFSTAINIEIGKFGIEFLRGVGERLAAGGCSSRRCRRKPPRAPVVDLEYEMDVRGAAREIVL